jgi:xylose isomerase
MKDWLRFSVCYWHTFRGLGADPFGGQTLFRPWDDGTNSMENALRRVDVAFEFFNKLGVDYYTFHDVDVSPQGNTLAESNKNFDVIATKLEAKQKETGVKLAWGTANLFSHWRYACGAATNPDAHVYAYAAAQVKKAMEVTYRLGGENYVFWGGREGYQSLLNTSPRRELDHLARFLQMAIDHKKSLGANFQLLIEPKPREPSTHQYDYDAQTVIGFLKHYGLDKDFKVNIEPNHTTLAGHSFEHDIIMSSKYGFLGSIDANTGDPTLGWDTDQFCMEPKKAMFVMYAVIEQGGLAPGVLNFDAKVRRESTDVEDLFIAHAAGMDTFARGLKAAAAIKTDGTLDKWVKERYATFDTGIGAKVEAGKTSFAELEKYVLEKGEVTRQSGKQEKYEGLINHFV